MNQYLLLVQAPYPDRIPQSGTILLVHEKRIAQAGVTVTLGWKGEYQLGAVNPPLVRTEDLLADVIVDLDTGKVEVRKGTE
ncbi:hypothetical protein A2215_00125 [Candidatus Berkelbacteria bacterium RIFOXYA2_FULL_43_10]|uniref:Uncharacterized protein n=1 Tax=Candidatus Berkelbacteria bacterium RIFOXYA2_FULL_43_10 TaxID=1797472 RepID=A0A1F5E9V6_9BACT|nr:MAG: hypothetical protein A2215_00125 [Candidatus Berkelbacteria bacterium RIFOXYA2_FULL_43_10]